MLILAASALEKASALPGSFWIKVLLGIAVFFVAVFILKKVMQTNKVIMIVVGFIFCSIVFINWVYERNEPAFLTPVVNVLAGFLPSKGAYEAVQGEDPHAPGAKKAKPKPAAAPKR
jgi:hypothetical protein